MDDGKKKSIKESKEAVLALKLLALKAIEIKKGGVTKEDIPAVLELVKDINVLVEGVKGAADIDDELKDIDQAELLELGTLVYSSVKEIAAAAKEA